MMDDDFVRQGHLILEAIAEAPSGRLESALHVALSVFDHTDVEVHNQLAEDGAIPVLTHRMMKSFYDEAPQREVELLCQLISIALRSDRDASVRSVNLIACDLVCTVLRVLPFVNESLSSTADEEQEGPREIIRRLADLQLSMTDVVRGDRLLRFLQQIIRDHDNQPWPLLESVMQLVDGLAHRESSKSTIIDTPGFLDDVLAYLLGDTADENRSMTIFYAVRFLRHLCWETKNKTKLVKHKNLMHVILRYGRLATLKIRQEALTSLWLLSYESSNRKIIVEYPQDEAVNTLVAAVNEPDLRSVALQTLLRLLSRSAARRCLKKALYVNWEMNNEDLRSDGLFLHEARLVERLAGLTSVRELCHTSLLSALQTMSTSQNETVRYLAAKGFLGQAQIKANLFFIARTPRVLMQLIQLATDDHPTVREKAVATMLQLVSEKSHAKLAAFNFEFLEALILVARKSADSEAAAKAGRMAIQAILCLADNAGACERIAKHCDVVATLATYGISGDGDHELKNAALHGVITLVHFL